MLNQRPPAAWPFEYKSDSCLLLEGPPHILGSSTHIYEVEVPHKDILEFLTQIPRNFVHIFLGVLYEHNWEFRAQIPGSSAQIYLGVPYSNP